MKTASRLMMLTMLLVAAVSALAQPEGRGNNRERNDDRGGRDRDRDRVEVQASVTFTVGQREAVSVYLGEQRNARSNCPPGLAKKNNGCQPPGQARRYTIGQPLPAGIVIEAVPDEISVSIGLPPPGYLYGMIDGDLVKLVAGTLLVIDAIDGLSQ